MVQRCYRKEVELLIHRFENWIKGNHFIIKGAGEVQRRCITGAMFESMSIWAVSYFSIADVGYGWTV